VPTPVALRETGDDAVHFLTRAPHAKLFPRCSAIVHHGGAGTTQSAVLAGRPSIVVPHAADQYFWADLLRARGLGAKPLRRADLTARALAARILATQADAAMRARVEVAAASMRRENGPLRAAELIDQALASVARATP
jgi:sterol 3beta-glucosyltransferase